jgi:anti-sigma B factor antagonist
VEPAAETFRVTAEAPDDSGRVRLVVVGELDLASAPLLEAALEEQNAAQVSVLLDLAGVTFMDSSGLKVLVKASREARSNGWAFAVDPQVGDAVRTVFDVVDAGHVILFAANGA